MWVVNDGYLQDLMEGGKEVSQKKVCFNSVSEIFERNTVCICLICMYMHTYIYTYLKYRTKKHHITYKPQENITVMILCEIEHQSLCMCVLMSMYI